MRLPVLILCLIFIITLAGCAYVQPARNAESIKPSYTYNCRYEESGEICLILSGKLGVFLSDLLGASFVYAEGEVDFVFKISADEPVYISASDELEPLVWDIYDYLAAGGIYKLQELIDESINEYTRDILHENFTEDEREYIKRIIEADGKIDIGIQHDVYPVTFYNQRDGEYQGAAIDVLREVTKLTGLMFEPSTTTSVTSLAEILEKLREGEIRMMTQLLYTESRRNDYIWSGVPYFSSSYALISSNDIPDLEAYQVYYVKVGTVSRSAHEEVFNTNFPDHPNVVSYSTTNEGYDALERGDIDLLMLAESMVFTLTHYREKPEYKVNYSFGILTESLFGYNKEEALLASVIDKAMAYIDLDKISGTWSSRAFDYSRKISEVRANYLFIISAAAFAGIAALFLLLKKNRRLQRGIEEKSLRLSTIITAIPDIIFSMDLSLRYTSANPAFERFSNLNEKEILGKTDTEIFPNEKKSMVDYFTEMNLKTIETREKVRIEEWVIYPDGSERYLETIKVPLLKGNEVVGIVGIAHDMTAYKAAEERAYEASKVKSMFLANMSHEIRTPMNAIIGMAELMTNETLTDRQRRYISDIKTSSHALLSIINDILDLSKIESGKLELNPIHYDFALFLDNISSMFRFIVEKKRLEYIFEVTGQVPKVLFGDDIRLRQILTNIGGNAVKFTNNGHIKFSVIAQEKHITFIIADTGMGIKEEEIPKLFDAFSQADRGKNRNVVGTGLGLAISKSFAEMMEGSIKVESVYGQGTMFKVTIPLITGDAAKVKYDDESKHGKRFIAPTASVLVVDDNEVNLKVASGLLSLYRIEAATALSGFDALELVRENDYDIVFMDHMMPGMDGIETTAKMREFGGKFTNLPIIALTANAVNDARHMFLSGGFNGFVSKPIEVIELAHTLREWLPKEKINEVVIEGKGERLAENESFLGKVRSIKEINLEVGLNHVSGVEQMYIETLRIFYKKLEGECAKLANFLEAEDMKSFAITVHGMKSTLATIGSVSLSESAYELEKVSKNGDTVACTEKLPYFLEVLRDMRKKLSGVFAGDDIGKTERAAGDVKFLQLKVKEAIEAAGEFDNNLGIEIINELERYDYGGMTNEKLTNARDSFADFDCDKAAEFLATI